MNVKYLLKFFVVSILFVAAFNFSSKAQFGDYSVQVVVENSSQTFSHFTNIVFADDFFGGTPTNAWDNCCDSYSLPPSSGQPMVYTSITEAPLPPNLNEIQFNTRPPLIADWSVPMGFDAGFGVTDVFTFTVDWLYTIPGNIGVELEDLQLGVTQDLISDNTYTFSGSHSDPEARFMIHFTILDACGVPNAPTFVNISGSNVDVLWACGSCSGGETFVLEYGLDGFTPGNGALAGIGGTIINPATPGLTISGLDPNTVYDFYIRTNCGTSYSENSIAGEVNTTDPACAIPEQAILAAASQTSMDIQLSCNSCVGGETFYIEYGPTGFTPGTDINPGTGGTIVQVTGATTTLSPLNPGTAYDVYVRTECGLPNFSDNSPVLTFITPGSTCFAPDMPTVSNITPSQADISWTCGNCVGGEIFVVEYGPSGFVPGTGGTPGIGGTVITPASSPLTITGLVASSTQAVYVRSYCGGSDYSVNSALLEFNTPIAPCPTPENVTVFNIGSNSVDVSWTCNTCSGGEIFILEYGLSGFTPGVDNNPGAGGTVISPVTSPFSLIQIAAGTNFDLYIRTRCNADFSSNSQVEQLSTCAVPSTPVVANITSTSAEVSWTCPACIGGEVFSIEYGSLDFPSTGGPSTVIQPATSPIVITGLTPNFEFSVYIQTFCSPSVSSNHSTLVNFQTPLTVDVTDNSGLSKVRLFPNPTNGFIKLSGELVKPVSLLNITVFDARGRIVLSKKVRNASGPISHDLDLTELSNGIYQLEVEGDGWKSNFKISRSW